MPPSKGSALSGSNADSAIGFLGRFTEERKGFPVLADAFVALAAERPRLRLLVAGPGERDDLFEMLPESVHDRVTFLG